MADMFVLTIISVARRRMESIVDKLNQSDKAVLAEPLSISEENDYLKDHPELVPDSDFAMIKISHRPSQTIDDIMAGVAKRVI